MTLCRRDLKPATLCEFEAAGRKANTVRAGTGKISVRKFMQGEFLPLRFFFLKPVYSLLFVRSDTSALPRVCVQYSSLRARLE